MEGDHDRDGKLSFEEFAQMVSNTVNFVTCSPSRRNAYPHISVRLGYREANDSGRFILTSYIPSASHDTIPWLQGVDQR